MRRRSLSLIRVRTRPAQPTRGVLLAGPLAVPVVLGRGGIRANKCEGDGATPRGRFRLVRLWWRADRHPRPRTLLPTRRITPDLAWCEDTTDRRYNRPFRRTPPTAAIACGGRIISTISSSRSTTTPARGWRAGAARSSCMWRGRTGRRRRDVWRSSANDLLRLLARLGPRTQDRNSNLSPGFVCACRPLAENRGADPDMRGAERDGEREIRAHAHRQQCQPVARARSWRSARNAGPAAHRPAECTSAPR